MIGISLNSLKGQEKQNEGTPLPSRNNYLIKTSGTCQNNQSSNGLAYH